MSKRCQITHKKPNNGYTVSHSHVRNKRIQYVNLQVKRIWSNKQNKWIKLKISTKAIKALHKLHI